MNKPTRIARCLHAFKGRGAIAGTGCGKKEPAGSKKFALVLDGGDAADTTLVVYRPRKKAAYAVSRTPPRYSNLSPIATVESLREERRPVYARHKRDWPGFTQ